MRGCFFVVETFFLTSTLGARTIKNERKDKYTWQEASMDTRTDKEKILERFRRENALADEREKDLDLKANALGILFSAVSFLILFIVAKVRDLDDTGARLMFLSIILGNTLYKFLRKRKELKTWQNVSYLLILVGGTILYIAYLVDWAR